MRVEKNGRLVNWRARLRRCELIGVRLWGSSSSSSDFESEVTWKLLTLDEGKE